MGLYWMKTMIGRYTPSTGKKYGAVEHTLLVTDTGVEVLTLREEESLPRYINH